MELIISFKIRRVYPCCHRCISNIWMTISQWCQGVEVKHQTHYCSDVLEQIAVIAVVNCVFCIHFSLAQHCLARVLAVVMYSVSLSVRLSHVLVKH